MKEYIESLLLGICEKLQLTPYQYKQAQERYDTIAKSIHNDDAFNTTSLNIYPHGSFRLKTTVKPLGREEYDLDFVAELPSDSTMSPETLYNHISRILKNDGIHNNMVELKKRCVRVKYANDFHMDIMPGKLINEYTHEIIVPDKGLKKWYHHSNPIAFADWFERQARTQIINELKNLRLIQCSVEEIDEQEVVARLEPLRRAVQLVKRFRDIYCKEYDLEPVRSIVICTLIGEITSFTGDTMDIIRRFCNHVNGLISSSNGQPFVVKNPVVDEILSEKWEEGNNYADFVQMITALTRSIAKLDSCKVNTEVHELLKRMFGESITNNAIISYVRKFNEDRFLNKLSVNKNGTINRDNSGKTVKSNTFYGSEIINE